MDSTQRAFLYLLECFLQGKARGDLPLFNEKKLLALSRNHSVSGIVAHALLTGYPGALSPKFADRFQIEKMSTIVSMTRKDYAFQQLLLQFSAENIPLIVLKGYILKEYYPVKELRTFGDVDILIHEKDRNKSHGIMKAANYWHQPCGQVWAYRKQYKTYDIHTHIMPETFSRQNDIKGYFDSPWNHAAHPDNPVPRLESTYHTIYILIHLAKHLSHKGAGVRMVLDIAVCMQNDKEIDWASVRRIIDSFHMGRFLDTVLCLCERWFGCVSPIPYHSPDDGTYALICEHILNSGVFGYHSENIYSSELRKLGAQTPNIRMRALLRAFFPAAAILKGRYPILKKHVYLFPVCWFARLTDILLHRRRRIKNRIAGIWTAREKALHEQDLLKKIGLVSEKDLK